jgi:hypothetical protein
VKPSVMDRYFRGLAFDAETMQVLRVVFDQVILTLDLEGVHYSSDLVAKIIIELARRGERDQARLRARTLRSLKLNNHLA